MNEEKKPYWKKPDWHALSVSRRYPFKLSDHSDWQDILSTYDCILEKKESEDLTTDEI